MAKIEVISSCVVGTTPNATSISTLELTTWDLPLLQTTAIQKGLLFHKPHDSPQNLIHHLKHTFSLALDLFPPLAGRLATTALDGDMVAFFVDCNNAGAEFTHAVAAAVSVSDIVDPKYTPQIVSSLFPLHEADLIMNLHGLSTPLLGVQVTELADGIFIGCTANHAVVDGTSFWHFINSWSQISRGCGPKPPVLERNVGDDNNNRVVHLPTLKRSLFSPSSPPPPQRVFRFSKESLDKLKAKANSEANTDKISTLQAVVGHVAQSTVRCGWVCESSGEALIMMAIGARARMGLGDTYFGNAAYVGVLAIGAAEILHKGLGYAALKINEMVSQQTNEKIIRHAEQKVVYQTVGKMCTAMTSGGGTPSP